MSLDINFDYKKYTLLAVDDNPANLSVISNLLQGYGFRVLTARDGESAIKRAIGHQPDLILLDVSMPGIDGFETCTRLMADSFTQETPVIFMTALASIEDKVKGFSTGAVDYITKPFQAEEVLVRIVTHLRMRDMTRSLRRQTAVIETTREIGQRISSILKLEHLLVAIVELIRIKFGYSFVGIWLADKKRERLSLAAGSNSDENVDENLMVASMSTTDPNQLPAVCLRNGQNLVINDTRLDKRYQPLPGAARSLSCLLLPLHFGGQVFGVLDVQASEANAFSDNTEAMMQSLVGQISIAVNNARLYNQETEHVQTLQELNESKDKFFSVVAHDLRAPFMPLLGTSKLLTRHAVKTGDQDAQEMAESINRSAANVFNLLENLLDWSRMQLGHIEYSPAPLNLKECAKKNVALLKDVAKSKQIVFTETVENDLKVYADERMLETILRNLASNALKFTPAGGNVTISARVSSAPDRVEIAVTDTGVGISPENQKKLFQANSSLSTEGTAEEKGTGLGLMICQEMVEKNNGRIWVESELGKSTVFSFTIPQHA